MTMTTLCIARKAELEGKWRKKAVLQLKPGPFFKSETVVESPSKNRTPKFRSRPKTELLMFHIQMTGQIT